MYHDVYQVWELLHRWDHRGPPKTEEVRALFRRDPGAATQRFSYNQTLLHRCVECYPEELDLISILLEGDPEASCTSDMNGLLPIHVVFVSESSRKATLETIKLLIEDNPESLITATFDGALPLHLACCESTDSSIVDYLIKSFPDAVQQRNKAGNFPLDYALEASTPNVEIVELLVEAYPIILTFSDDEGQVPLHRVFKAQRYVDQRRRKPYDAIVEVLAEHGPGALQSIVWFGNGPSK